MLTSNNINPLEAHPAEAALAIKGKPLGQALPQGSKFSELFASMYGKPEAETTEIADGAMPLTLPKDMALAVEDYVDAVGIEEGVAELATIVDSAVQVQTTLTAIHAEQGQPVTAHADESLDLPVNGLGLASAELKKALQSTDLDSQTATADADKNKQDSAAVINLMQQALNPKSQQGFEQSGNPKTLLTPSNANLDKGLKTGLLASSVNAEVNTKIDSSADLKGAAALRAELSTELDSEYAVTDGDVNPLQTTENSSAHTTGLAVADKTAANSAALNAADIATAKANQNSVIAANLASSPEVDALAAEDSVEATNDINSLVSATDVDNVETAEFGSEVKQPKGLVENAALPNSAANANSEVVQSAIQARDAGLSADLNAEQTQQQAAVMPGQTTASANVNSAAAVNASQNSNLANNTNGYTTQWGAANAEGSQQTAGSTQNGQTGQSNQQQSNQQAFANQQQMMQFQENAKAKLQAVEQQMAVKAADELVAKADSKGSLLGGGLSISDSRAQLPVGLQSIGVPVKSSQWGQALGQRVVFMANNNVQQARIVLNPENLGPVQLKIHMDKEQQIHVTMTAQHATTREAMENAIPRLKEMLENAGLDLASVDVGDERQFAQNEQDAESNASALAANHKESDADTADTTEVTSVAATDNIVDYYA